MTTAIAVPSVFGRYELRSVLGRGGTGVVYEAMLVGLVGFRKRVALKVLAATAGDDPQARAALQREARLGAALSHPNVVSILDLGREKDRWFIAMELVDGHPVSALLRAGPVAPAATVEIGLAACAGLAHIHDLRIEGSPGGLVHRDIKPENLLVDRNGTLKVADFGIAALVHAVGDRVGGTPTWMAPEQALGRAGPRSDLFSLGAVLYALAARRKPFGSGAAAIREAARVEVLLTQPGFLGPVEHAVPGLGRIVGRCLRLDPEERYPSAQALAAELRMLRPALGAADLALVVESVKPVTSAGVAPPRASTASTSSRAASSTVGEAALVGRAADIEVVAEWILEGRGPVTLTGAGGVGKTRVARAVAERLRQGELCHPLWVELVGIRSDDGALAVPRAVATALGIDLVQGDPWAQVESASTALPGLLLVLDGAEGAVDRTREAVDRLAAAVPGLRVLVTSRLPLRCRGELVRPVPPLSVTDGAALFLAGARGPVSAADRARLGELVEALDGLPLAIELAAARARTLGVAQILERLRDRFRLLVDPSGPAGAGLRSTLATSFGLLKPWEARAVGELSVFVGGFSLEAAEAVIKLDAWPEAPWALDVLSSLLDASLLSFDRDRSRFRLGHAVRDFAAETLAPEVLSAALVRHGEYFSQLGAEDIEQTTLRSSEVYHRTLEAELANLRAATERAVARRDAVVASRAAFAAAVVYANHGPAATGALLLDAVLGLPGLPHRSRLLVLRWSLRRSLGQRALADADLSQAEREADQSKDHARRLQIRALRLGDAVDRAAAVHELREVVAEARARGELHAEARANNILGNRLLELEDRAGSRAALEQALRGFSDAADRRGAALATLRLGRVDLGEGRLADAVRRFGEAEAVFREVQDQRNLVATRENRAVAHADAGALDEARATFAELLEDARRYGDRWTEANTCSNLGVIDRRMGRVGDAREWFAKGLATARMGSFRELEARTLTHVAELEHLVGDLAAARDAWRAAAEVFRTVRLDRAAAAADAQRLLAEFQDGAPGSEGLREVLAGLDGFTATGMWIDLAHAHLDRGDIALSEASLAVAARLRSGMPPRAVTEASFAVAAARIGVVRGRLDESLLLLAGAERDLREEGSRIPLWVGRVELLLAAGDRTRARRALAALEASIERAGCGPATPGRRSAARLRARCGVDAPSQGG